MKLKYLSQAEGLMVNVSYGDNVLHSEQVKGNVHIVMSEWEFLKYSQVSQLYCNFLDIVTKLCHKINLL